MPSRRDSGPSFSVLRPILGYVLQVLAVVLLAPVGDAGQAGAVRSVGGAAGGGSAPSARQGQQTVLPRQLGSVHVDLHGNGRATVSWRTSDVSLGWLRYGTGPIPSQLVADPVRSEEHRVELTGLLPDTVYRYSIFARGTSNKLTQTEVLEFLNGGTVTGSGVEGSGNLRPWAPLTLDFQGPFHDERDDAPNPFLDYRLDVTFTSPGGKSISVPGFFDGDGLGGGSGSVWRVRFVPNVPGVWSFTAHFRMGTDVAVAASGAAGTATGFDGTSGTFEILPPDPAAPGFYRWGKLAYVNEHYLKFFDGPYFIKGGSNSPENLLGYAGFDDTVDQGGLSTSGLVMGLHRYMPHRGDFGPPSVGGLGSWQDPLFRSRTTLVDSVGLVGALNYLASVHVNSLFVMPMNLGGDGWEVTPFIGYAKTPFDKTHYDISKLAQWNEIFEHIARRGMLIQFVLAEYEAPNRTWLDGGTLGVERKLFYRELIARFGHLPAIKWNISEECDYTTAQVKSFAGYIQSVDPYNHPIGFHVNLLPVSGASQQYDDVLGDPRFSTNSLQAIPYTASDLVEKWRADSAAAGHKWVVDFDEQLQPLTNQNASDLRKLELYDTLFSGGNIEWYAGYFTLPLGGDLRMEDFRTREEMWNYTWYARKVLENNLPFWAMKPMDSLVSGESTSYGGAEVLALPGYAYAVYYPEATATGTLDLGPNKHVFHARWYNPRTGKFEGGVVKFRGSGPVPVQPVPRDPGEDWVLIVRR